MTELIYFALVDIGDVCVGRCPDGGGGGADDCSGDTGNVDGSGLPSECCSFGVSIASWS